MLDGHQSVGEDLAVRADLFAEQVDQEVVAARLTHCTVLSSVGNTRVTESTPTRLSPREKIAWV